MNDDLSSQMVEAGDTRLTYQTAREKNATMNLSLDRQKTL